MTARKAIIGSLLAGVGVLAGCVCERGASVGACVPFDLQGYIDGRIQAGERRIVVPPGRYRVKPQRAQHLVLKGLRDVTIVADHVEMVCAETSRALTLVNCTNVTVRGLAIDYDPLPFTQGRIVSLSEDKRVHEIELFDGYPTADKVDGSKYEIFRPDTRTLRCPDYRYTVEVLDARHLRVLKDRGRAEDLEQVGDIVVIGASDAPGGRSAHAVVAEESQSVRLEKISLYASNCFGFFESACDGTVYDRCRIDRRPAETDPVRRGAPRIRSTNADAFHSKHAVRGPRLIGCEARYQGDDGLNICGDYHLVTECRGRVLRVLAKHRMNIAPGDPVELFAYDGRRLPDAAAVAVVRDGSITAEERAFVGAQRMDEGLRARGCADAYVVTLDREAAVPKGSAICSARRVGNGFLVKGCTFGHNRSRGVLIKGSRGAVVGNTLVGNRMSAILVSPEYWWLEAGSSCDVEIRDNVIEACGRAAIEVTAHGAKGEVASAGAHSRITVAGNRITGCPSPCVEVTSTDALAIRDNRIDALLGLAAEAIRTNNCTAVTLKNNRVR